MKIDSKMKKQLTPHINMTIKNKHNHNNKNDSTYENKKKTQKITIKLKSK